MELYSVEPSGRVVKIVTKRIGLDKKAFSLSGKWFGKFEILCCLEMCFNLALINFFNDSVLSSLCYKVNIVLINSSLQSFFVDFGCTSKPMCTILNFTIRIFNINLTKILYNYLENIMFQIEYFRNKIFCDVLQISFC